MAKLDRLVGQAHEHLEPGEVVLAAVQGSYETKILGSDTTRAGVLLATDRRIVFYAKKLGGFDLESFPYRGVSSFEQSKSMMGFSVAFFASGNRVHMKWIPATNDVVLFTDVIKRHLHAGSSGVPAQVDEPANAQRDTMSLLRQLGELREAGVLTQQEFDDKKAELLSRL